MNIGIQFFLWDFVGKDWIPMLLMGIGGKLVDSEHIKNCNNSIINTMGMIVLRATLGCWFG